MSPQATVEVERLRQIYGEVTVEPSDPQSDLVTVAAFPCPAGWTPGTARVAVRVPTLYPAQALDTFLITRGVRSPSGQPARNVMTQVQIGSDTWDQISWHWNGPWDPTSENLVTFVRSIGRYLRDTP